jgi:hypothetical protein
MDTKKRRKIICDCKKCNGKLIDPRTRNKHEEERRQVELLRASRTQYTQLSKKEDDPVEEGID